MSSKQDGGWAKRVMALAAFALLAAGSVVGPDLARADTPSSAGQAKAPRPPPTLADYDVSHLKLGGDFTLTNQDGKRTSLKLYRGRALLLFFGYTFCPDVCPVSLAKVARVRKGLGPLGAKLQPVFVTIDPERDTPARLKAYVANFEAGAIGMTGTPAEVEQAAHLFRARYEREDPKADANYLMAHTAYLYLVDGRGKLRYVFPPDVQDKLLDDGIRKVLGT